MSARNIDANSKLTMAYELPVGMADGIALRDQDSTRVDAPRSILQSAMAELGEGRIEEVVALFNEHFKFNDHAMIRSVQDDFATRAEQTSTDWIEYRTSYLGLSLQHSYREKE